MPWKHNFPAVEDFLRLFPICSPVLGTGWWSWGQGPGQTSRSRWTEGLSQLTDQDSSPEDPFLHVPPSSLKHFTISPGGMVGMQILPTELSCELVGQACLVTFQWLLWEVDFP